MVGLPLVHSLPLIGIDQDLWETITDIAHRERMSVGDLLVLIDQRRTAAVSGGRPPAPLAFAVRVFVIVYQRQFAGAAGTGPLAERFPAHAVQ